MKKFKKFLAILLVASMIFTTDAVNIFAEGNKANQEEQLNEESEETTVGAEEESVGAKLGEPETDAEEESIGAEEESVGAKLGEPEEETTVGTEFGEPEVEDEEKSETDKMSESDSDAAENSDEISGKDLEKNKKSQDDLYGSANDPYLFIYFCGMGYSSENKDIMRKQIFPDEFRDFVANPNPGTPLWGVVEELTTQLPAKMTFKGFRKVSEETIPEDYGEEYEYLKPFEDNYTPDGNVDYADLASIDWDGEHDMIVYTVYDTISFNIKYLDVDDDYKVQTIKFDDTQEEDLRNFIQEQFDKGINKCLALETDEAINGYTGEEENIDYKNIDYMEVKYMEWAQNPNSTVWYGLFYYIPKYFNVIYIKDQGDFLTRTNSFRTYTVGETQSDFQGDINSMYEKRSNDTRPEYDIFYDTKGVYQIENFKQSDLQALVSSPSICLGPRNFTHVGLLDDKFESWKNGAYPEKSVCWVVKYAATYKWYALGENGASSVEYLDSVRKISLGVDNTHVAFDENNELYAKVYGKDIPKQNKVKGFKIVPYTDIPVESRAETRKYYLQEYCLSDAHKDDTDLKTLEEFESMYMTWTESNDDIYNGYAAFLVYEPAPKEFDDYYITTYPEQHYYEGQTFDPAKLVIRLKYKYGYDEENLPYVGNEDKFTFELPSGEDALTNPLAKVGESDTVSLKVIYEGIEKNFDVYVHTAPKVITGISVKTPPKTSYDEGQKFDPTNLVINVEYEDGTNEDIEYNNTTKDNFSFTLPSSSDALVTPLTPGNTNVTIGYGGKTATLPLTVNQRTVQSIEIEETPKQEYKSGEKFDPQNLVIKVNYSSGDPTYIEYNDGSKNDFSFEIDGIGTVNENTTINTLGKLDVKVTYKEKSDTYSINVKTIDRLEGVAIGKTTYREGETFDPAGLQFRVVYTDGTNEIIDYAVEPDGITFNPTMTTALKTTDDKVTVSYKGFSYDIALTVNPDDRIIESVEVTKEPDKTEYEQGQKVDGTGMVIHVKYTNGDEVDIPYDIPYNTDFSFDPSVLDEVGDEIEVSVIYKGVPSKEPIKVKVNKKLTPNPSNPSNQPRNNGGTGGTGGGSSDSGSSDPTKGPMGDLSKKPTNVDSGHKIPENKLFVNPQLISSYADSDSSIFNARDVDSNVGYGRWIQIQKTPVWYFLTYDFDLQKNNTKPLGFLANGWYKVDWDGIDKWYYFDQEGVMKMGWFNDNGKIYYLQDTLNDHWYGSMQTGVQYINDVRYIFDDKGALIVQ